MALIPDGYAQANLRFTDLSSPNGAEITLGIQLGLPGAGPADVAGIVAEAWGDTIRTVMPATVELGSVLVKFGPNLTGPSAELSAGTNGSGGGASGPPNVAILVHKNTALGGRAGRGRFYHPGAQESEVDPSGNLTPAFVAGMQTQCNTFFSDLDTAGLALVLLHSDGSPITAPTVLTGLTVDARVATQRRRLRG